jgi:hypothetical protein
MSEPATSTEVERIITLVRSANEPETEYGLTWYAKAHAWAAELATEYDRSVSDIAGIIAALSPQTNWPDNQRKADQLIETGLTYGLGANVAKAGRILAGEDPDEVLGGPKVRAFWRTLADPTNTDDVVIDRHAFDATVGAVTDDKTRQRALERKGGYERVADIYRSAARILGLAPSTVQAITWAVWRNRYGRYHYQHHGASHDTLRPYLEDET